MRPGRSIAIKKPGPHNGRGFSSDDVKVVSISLCFHVLRIELLAAVSECGGLCVCDSHEGRFEGE